MRVLILLSLLVALFALWLAAAGVRRGQGRAAEADLPEDLYGLRQDVLGLRQEVAALRAEATGAVRHVAVVRYDAFGGASGVGGKLSWSLALLDDQGDGVVLSAIHGRSGARSYAKSIAGWACPQPLSPEEQDAVSAARP